VPILARAHGHAHDTGAEQEVVTRRRDADLTALGRGSERLGRASI
jgi:hypothetical protein